MMADTDYLANFGQAMGSDPSGSILHLQADQVAPHARSGDTRARATP
jgi:hypothetical protein